MSCAVHRVLRKRLCFAAMLAMLAGAGLSCNPPAPGASTASLQPAAAAMSPPKRTESPLLLLDDPAEPTPRSASMADNRRCEVCHLHLIQEELALSHARAGVGCAKCHGDSDAHIADESWASGGNGTAPDIMFPKARINPGCLECHPKAKLSSGFHQEFFAGASQEKYCTGCHGAHRIVNRKCKWK